MSVLDRVDRPGTKPAGGPVTGAGAPSRASATSSGGASRGDH